MTATPLTRRRTLGLVAGTIGTALAGCLGAIESDDSGGTGELGDPAGRVEVETMSIPQPSLDPGLVHIERGGTVEWVGQGQRNAVAAYHPDAGRVRRAPDGEPAVTHDSDALPSLATSAMDEFDQRCREVLGDAG